MSIKFLDLAALHGELSDDLEGLGATNGHGKHAREPRGRGGSTSSSRSGGAQPTIEEEDQLDLELEALANGTDPETGAVPAGTTGADRAKMAKQLAIKQQQQIARKGKRAARANSISEEGRYGSGGGGVPLAKANLKNSRKSRSGLGRGLPKKGKHSNSCR